MIDENNIVLNLADVVLALRADRKIDRVQIDESFRPFICDSAPDIKLRALASPMPPLFPQANSLIFEVQNRWALYSVDEQNALVLRHSKSPSVADRLMLLDTGFTNGEVFIRGPYVGDSPAVFPNPLDYPLGQVLMTCLLARGRGIMVHACGVDDYGRGYLFAGNSGHGKSTMARLWPGQGRILNDDRVVVREQDGRFWVHSTPWHGDYTTISPQPVPLAAVFFLAAGTEHRVGRIIGTQASTKLLTRSFPPLWSAEGMAYTLDLFARLTAAVPCYDLEFVPDSSIVDFIRCLT